MVFFSCDVCSDAVKKNQVEKHSYRCRSATYSCMDCNEVFTVHTYKSHMKCISEDQKYGGKNFVPKDKKGEVKQNQWIEQVERAIANVNEPDVKNLLHQILGFANIPRKEAKFVNFLQNSVRVRNVALCSKAWKCINEAAAKVNTEVTEPNAKEDDEKISPDSESATASENTHDSTVSENGNSKENGHSIESSLEKRPFKWRKAIKRTLKEAEGGEMKLKKLRKIVIAKYFESVAGNNGDEEALRSVFNEKLHSSGVLVQGHTVSIS